MRYLAGITGGFVVAIALFVFQDHLIGGEPAIEPRPTPHIFLPTAKMPSPTKTKTYEPRQPPPEPEPIEHPETVNNTETDRPRPERMFTPSIGDAMGQGTGPDVGWGGGAPDMDGQLGVKTPIEPRYPSRALLDGIEGEVEVEFTVLPDGSVTDVRIVRADPPGVFEQSARRAILRWQFIPKRVDGEPVEVRARQVIMFRLPE